MTYSKLPVLEDLEAIEDCLDLPDTSSNSQGPKSPDSKSGKEAKNAWSPNNKMTFSNLPVLAATSMMSNSNDSTLESEHDPNKESKNEEAEDVNESKDFKDDGENGSGDSNFSRKDSSRAKWRARQMGTFSKVPITPIDENSRQTDQDGDEKRKDDLSWLVLTRCIRIYANGQRQIKRSLKLFFVACFLNAMFDILCFRFCFNESRFFINSKHQQGRSGPCCAIKRSKARSQ